VIAYVSNHTPCMIHLGSTSFFNSKGGHLEDFWFFKDEKSYPNFPKVSHAHSFKNFLNYPRWVVEHELFLYGVFLLFYFDFPVESYGQNGGTYADNIMLTSLTSSTLPISISHTHLSLIPSFPSHSKLCFSLFFTHHSFSHSPSLIISLYYPPILHRAIIIFLSLATRS